MMRMDDNNSPTVVSIQYRSFSPKINLFESDVKDHKMRLDQWVTCNRWVIRYTFQFSCLSLTVPGATTIDGDLFQMGNRCQQSKIGDERGGKNEFRRHHKSFFLRSHDVPWWSKRTRPRYNIFGVLSCTQSAQPGECENWEVRRKNRETTFGPEEGDLNHSGDNMIMGNGFTRKITPTDSFSSHQREQEL